MMDPQSVAPPSWAEAWLRASLPVRDRETVSGDLLEEYRAAIRPSRSQLAADLWYIGQVSVFAWRTGFWALVLASIFVGRTALDWFVPVSDFAQRAETTTLMTASILLVIGASHTLRTQSISAGVVGTATVVTLTAVLCTLANGVIYARWHDAATLAAIERSGGLLEVFLIPLALMLPGTAVGSFGAWLASRRRPATALGKRGGAH
jgi:hypothetical protein